MVLVRGDAELASWPLAGRDRPDLAVVGKLARLQLAARRRGCSIRLRDACVELLELLDLLGLGEIVSSAADPRPRDRVAPRDRDGGCREGGLCRKAGGETEGSEQVGVEEVVVTDDPVT